MSPAGGVCNPEADCEADGKDSNRLGGTFLFSGNIASL